MSDWREISKEAAFVSHRLIGWIYWDPDAINAYTKLGFPMALAITSRQEQVYLGKPVQIQCQLRIIQYTQNLLTLATSY